MNHEDMCLSPSSEYLTAVRELMETASRSEAETIRQASTVVAEAFERDGMLYVFGSGHSHIFAEEAFYRAGGSARICPVLQPSYMLHVSAQRSTELERENGHAASILDHYPIQDGVDVMLVVSNSGSNALPIEVAALAKARGLTVIAITSVEYARSTTATGPRLHDIADIVLDNHCPPGDALVSLGYNLPRVGPGSSVIGISLMNAVIVEAISRQVANHSDPAIYLSAGMPGAAEHNRELADRFRSRIPHV
ncbi:MAG: hypothetical protein B5766_03395 [Candidatus Lumbricidophila eiseniae]|uniref:SIS domain-containing protein n=1 Tax=Candidatus Lumbricidiphila eiseniae TaxID=1969409 RepID=A0A2A6FTI3_9MICO|nr:MAG: hypothetical protein B5766_03395 [Candidatus Lumbricidophila eiseniae]